MLYKQRFQLNSIDRYDVKTTHRGTGFTLVFYFKMGVQAAMAKDNRFIRTYTFSGDLYYRGLV